MTHVGRLEQGALVVDRHVQHPAEDVLVRAAPGLPLGDDPGEQVLDVAVAGECLAVPAPDQVAADEGQGGDVGAAGRVRHRRDEGGHEGIDALGVEAVEGVAEAAAADRLQCQLRQPRGDVDDPPRARALVPDRKQLVRRGGHDVVVAAHRRLGEGGHEQVVGQAPVRLVGPGGEESVPDEHPQVVHADMLVTWEHSTAGELRQPRNAVRFGGRAVDVPEFVDGVGESTDAILAEIGRTTDQIAALRSADVVA